MNRGQYILSSLHRWNSTSSFSSRCLSLPLNRYTKINYQSHLPVVTSIRQASTLVGSQQLQQSKRINGLYKKLGYTTTILSVGAVLYHTNENFRHLITAFQRCGTAGKVGVLVALDYKWTLSQQYESEANKIEAKKKCHLRCAQRVLDSLQQLGGIYVKLGQHVSALVYLLPIEWTSTMAVLQDRCDPTSEDDIRALFLSDYGQPLENVFDEFDWKPIGVASLAQVHKAKLKKTLTNNKLVDGSHGEQWVAVKFQHPHLDEFCKIDMHTVSFIFDCIHTFFPDFGFSWLVQEMKESLPQEMNFVHEANNARQVNENFNHHPSTSLVIPKTYWAIRRIMCMEFIDGARIDNLDYMKKYNIDPRAVSSELTKVFSEMIFIHGFVHCDPHPGNVIIRPTKNKKKHGHNFDLVLLDHGLYRTLTNELRTDYANLWTSLIKGNEEGIRTYSHRVGGTEGYQLFACMLTGREWNKIHNADLNSIRDQDELTRMSSGAIELLVEVADILGKMPRTVLLLLKTNDLLRHVDEQLNPIPDEKLTYVIMGQYCTKAVWLDTKSKLMDQLHTLGWQWNLFKQLMTAWWRYQSLEYTLWVYQLASVIVDDLRIFCMKWSRLLK